MIVVQAPKRHATHNRWVIARELPINDLVDEAVDRIDDGKPAVRHGERRVVGERASPSPIPIGQPTMTSAQL